MAIPQIILLVFAAYLSVGLCFGVLFVVRGVSAVDHAAHNAAWPFRLMILPGCVALWPVLWIKWRQASHHSSRRSA